jgi:prephenate dehydrogenase
LKNTAVSREHRRLLLNRKPNSLSERPRRIKCPHPGNSAFAVLDNSRLIAENCRQFPHGRYYRTMTPKRISIIGVGLLGGSIGLAAKARLTGCKITGYGHRRSTLDAALNMGALDEAYDTLSAAVADADLIILCTPVGLFRSLLSELAPLVSRTALITDVGSTKRSIVAAADELLSSPEQFVASHPMAGSEKRGVQYSRADLYDGALCILTPASRTSSLALKAVEDFWKLLGMQTCRVSPEAHDRLLADVSHLPHALAAALVSMQDPSAFPLAGKGFHDMTRIAGGDGGLWGDILLDNRDNVRQSIVHLKERLDHLLSLLQDEQADALRNWLDAVAEKRQGMLDARGKSDCQ